MSCKKRLVSDPAQAQLSTPLLRATFSQEHRILPLWKCSLEEQVGTFVALPYLLFVLLYHSVFLFSTRKGGFQLGWTVVRSCQDPSFLLRLSGCVLNLRKVGRREHTSKM